MKNQKIAILGPIGTFKIGEQMINGVQLKDVIAKVTALPADTDTLTVDIGGPGGNKQVGDSIYTYLMSLKPKIKIVMNQVDDVGSICSKIWFAGDERVALEGLNQETGKPFEIFIHNPWMKVVGDANAMQQALNDIKPEEEELQSFYVAQTGIPVAGIKPLMDAETGLDAATAVSMKFATSKRTALKIAAYKTMNTNTQTAVKKEDENLVQSILAFLGKGKAKPNAAALGQPAGGAPAQGAGSAAQPAAAAGSLADAVGKPVMVNGTAALDGVYSVKGGVVTAVEDLAEEANEPAAAAADVKRLENVLAAIKAGKSQEEIVALANGEDLNRPVTMADLKEILAGMVGNGGQVQKTTHKPAINNGKQTSLKQQAVEAEGDHETPVQALKRMRRTGEKA